jgi:hypothetical protein
MNIKLSRSLSRAQITFFIALMLLCLLQDQLGIKVPKVLAEEHAFIKINFKFRTLSARPETFGALLSIK